MIEPGQKVRNKVNGIEGYVTTRCVYLTMSPHLWVQPWIDPDKPNEEPKQVWDDEYSWEELDGVIERRPEPEEPQKFFELGTRVRDIVTGFSGIATVRTEAINRCVTYHVQAEDVNARTGQTGAFESFSANRLELVDKGLAKKAKELARAASPSGGPERKGA